jgi:NagD protein
MLRLTVQINEEHFYTSALATAEFLARQRPVGSVFVIGEAGLTKALYDAGFSIICMSVSIKELESYRWINC